MRSWQVTNSAVLAELRDRRIKANVETIRKSLRELAPGVSVHVEASAG